MTVADFSGYATKAGIRCTDGRTIMPKAFEHMDGKTVPLVWQHQHNETKNILGRAILRARPDGIYAEGYFNATDPGKQAKQLVEHGDITSLSIYANRLAEKPGNSPGSKMVVHGEIREVSLVLSGANEGAKIDFVRLQHGDDPDDFELLEDEAVIRFNLPLEHADSSEEDDEDEEEIEEEDLEHADYPPDATVEDVYNSLTDVEKSVVNYMIGAALDSDVATHSENEEGIAHTEGNEMTGRNNVFEQNRTPDVETFDLTLQHVQGMVKQAEKLGSMKEAVEEFALKHGITNIDILFPDARTLQDRPEFNKRRTEWVDRVMSDTSHSPFARVKTIVADITQDEARAKGYIKGNYKREEWFGVSKRTTTPTTVYKKQALDRDDMIDITDFDVVAWLKLEMRMMLDEELARAILIGDGRDVGDVDKIKDPIGAADGAGIRSILNDHELFVTTLNVNVDDANSTYDEVIDSVLDGMEFYKGTGVPSFYCTIRTLNMFLKAKDGFGRRLYPTVVDVAAALNVKEVVTVESMSEVTGLVGIIVNLRDYNIGTDKGGEVNTFDDFDIDYNKQKYLIETRLSGALTKVKSALVIMKVAAGAALVTPTAPTFVPTTGVITIPTVTGVIYKNGAGTTLTAGAQTALAAGASLTVNAFTSSGSYYFADNARDSWTFKRPA